MTDHPATGEQRVRAPHAPLTSYYESEAERSSWVRSMFNDTASDYDRIELLLGFGSGSWYRRQALLRAGLVPGMIVADVGVGTGLVAKQIAAIVGDPTLVTGIDPSPGMLHNARVPEGVRLVEGTAESIPFNDSQVDFLSMGYAMRHIGDLSAAAVEFHRVLKPGGRLCILEITCPENWLHKAVLKTYLRGIVPLLAKLAARNGGTSELWRYYWDTIEECVSPQQVMRTIEQAGFVDVKRHCELGMFSEYTATKAVSLA